MDVGDEMQEVIVGGKGVLLQMLLDLVQKAIHAPSELFDKQVKLTEKSKQITKAAKKPHLDQTAERVATIVNTERPVAPAMFPGLIREEAVSNTASLRGEVQSLKAKMESLLVGKTGGVNQPKSKAKNKKKPPVTKTPPDGSTKHGSKQAPAKNCRGDGSGNAGARPAVKQ